MTKIYMYRNVTSTLDQQNLQIDIDNLWKWSEDWFLKFNIDKYKLVSFGNAQNNFIYYMSDDKGNVNVLKQEESGKDFGIGLLKFKL